MALAASGRVGRRTTTWLVAALTLGCGGGNTLLLPPEPVATPRIEVDPEPAGPKPADAYLHPPEPELGPEESEVVSDELLASPVFGDPEFEDAVAEWVGYWRDTASPWFPDFLRRMGGFRQTVESALAERDMPSSLRYLPLIESGYDPRARSRASAVGLWQFMEGTAGDFDMEVTPFVDERRNPFKSTEGAVRYLSDLRERFGSWFLALAAYNAGPTRTRRILNRYAALAPRSDSLFWALRGHFPRETRDFVPKLIGAIIVAEDPSSHGYEPGVSDAPFAYDEVEVPDATTFEVIARAAGVEEAEIAHLNPELVRGFTPPGQSFQLRVPPGTGRAFDSNYAEIPAGERMTLIEHYVAEGETLSHIAVRYGVSLADLEASNPDVRPRFLRIGTRLTVPILLGRSRGR